MPKVRTLSREFMKGHPKAGQPTFFVEKVLKSIGIDYFHSSDYTDFLKELNWDKISKGKLRIGDIHYFSQSLKYTEDNKLHTVRSGHHFKKGDLIQLAVWSGKPYASPQIKICPELEVVKVYDFQTWKNYTAFSIDSDEKPSSEIIEKLSKNDGLSMIDFEEWFKFPSDFKGQIICWKDPEY